MERDRWDPIAGEAAADDEPVPESEREAEEAVVDAEEPGGREAVERRAEDRGGEARRVPPGRLEPAD